MRKSNDSHPLSLLHCSSSVVGKWHKGRVSRSLQLVCRLILIIALPVNHLSRITMSANPPQVGLTTDQIVAGLLGTCCCQSTRLCPGSAPATINQPTTGITGNDRKSQLAGAICCSALLAATLTGTLQGPPPVTGPNWPHVPQRS